jgi:hypothetical protein
METSEPGPTERAVRALLGCDAELSPEAVSAAVVHLVEALTYSHRVRALHEADIMSGRAPDPRAVLDLRIAAGREADAAEDDLTTLVDGVDHERALALIRQLGEAQRDAVARAEKAYLELPASPATS